MASSLLSVFSFDLAIDPGTNPLVFARNQGFVVNEQSIVAVRMISSRIDAVGAVYYQVESSET
jgi:actin-like ATPase involved in cell morphogenesis